MGQHALHGGGDQEGFHPHIEKPGDCPGGVVGMETGHDQVPGEAGLNRNLGGFKIAGLSHQDFVRILPKKGPEGPGEGQPDPLIGRNLDDPLQLVFHRILHGKNFGVDGVDPTQTGVKSGRFAGTGRAGDDEDSVGFFQGLANVIKDVFGNAQLFQVQIDNGTIQHPQHDAFAVLGRQGGDPEVDLAPRQ